MAAAGPAVYRVMTCGHVDGPLSAPVGGPLGSGLQALMPVLCVMHSGCGFGCRVRLAGLVGRGGGEVVAGIEKAGFRAPGALCLAQKEANRLGGWRLLPWLVYCFTLMGAYRARQFVSGKAPFAGNSGALAKSGNAAGRELARSLRASRQKAVRGVAFPRHRPTMPSKMRRAAHLLATR
ncbi:hypothetical protein A8C75_12435 [Marinobacterium aestuarii]|uniref:Uncharacterized protein n=1 Tax=Marinobacterium aestuarii TaxID=1821621 RepID=A0A1A9EZD3_9GAMM|nr:hypothetical protein A8C75_12435 [Marinobacterium aestuarii]